MCCVATHNRVNRALDLRHRLRTHRSQRRRLWGPGRRCILKRVVWGVAILCARALRVSMCGTVCTLLYTFPFCGFFFYAFTQHTICEQVAGEVVPEDLPVARGMGRHICRSLVRWCQLKIECAIILLPQEMCDYAVIRPKVYVYMDPTASQSRINSPLRLPVEASVSGCPLPSVARRLPAPRVGAAQRRRGRPCSAAAGRGC